MAPRLLQILSLVLYSGSCLAQTIQNIWETTSDKRSLLKALPSSSSVSFGLEGSGDAEINIDEITVYQTVFGFGATLTDGAAFVLSNLKMSNTAAYSALLKSMFDVSSTANSAGLNYIRVPIGASDFSPNVYSYDDTSNDTSLSSFSPHAAPSYFFSTLKDIQSINADIKLHLLPWSPPAWMKENGSMKGGNFSSKHIDHMANYLLKSVQAFHSRGLSTYAVSIQNEPENSNPTLPSALYTTSSHAAVAVSLRNLLNSSGLTDVKVIGYEHNWDDAAAYATQLMKEDGASDAFDGVAFHCYAGDVSQQDDWHNSFPNKELYFTECSGTLGSDWWSDIQYYMRNLFIGGIQHWAQSGLMWSLVLDPEGNPRLPGASSCASGCRGVVQVSSDGPIQLNQEYYAMAHAAKAILPVDSSGQFGQRIQVDVSGDALTVGAYLTKTSSSSVRYSLVVMNSGDSKLQTSIKFRGKTAVYSFPVGLTTMSWTA